MVGKSDVRGIREPEPVCFGRSFVHSEAFTALFQEGMELVEEVAAYLDGPGREESRNLPREGSRAYASESMRLTTRLMQIASWLLVQRALAEGEIAPREAQRQKSRLRLEGQPSRVSPADFQRLPRRLRELLGLSARLHARILHLEMLITDPIPAVRAGGNPVAAQHWLLQRAFGEHP